MTTESYIKNQKYYKVEIGDIVTVLGRSYNEGWDIWADEMDSTVGKTGKVLAVKSTGILVKIPDVPGPAYQKGGWYFPYTSLRIIR